jgi:hypothetical protein
MKISLLLLAFTMALPVQLASAQGTPGPPLPVGMDMRKAPLGAWSAYTVNVTGMPAMKQRFALVARDAATNTVELTTEGGMMGPGTPVILRVVLEADLSRKDRVKKLIMQLGDNPPMELRQEGEQKTQFAPLDPRKLVGKETLKVAAGTIATRHFREKTSAGRTDIWVSDEAPPFGIVKLQGTVSQAPGAASYPVTVELTARGKDARPVVVRPPQPFDPQVLMGQMNRALGGAKGKGPGKD